LQERTDELDQSNAFLESILSSVESGVVVINRDFEILLWNERAEDLWGLRSDEVVGRSFLGLDIGLPVEKLAEPVRSFLAGDHEEDEQVLELEAVNRRGQSIVVHITNTLRRGPEEEIEGVVLLMRRVNDN
jgi:two-component system CheB/CheR fusion protein